MDNKRVINELIEDYLKKIGVIDEPFFKGIPYPQADDLNKLRQLVESSFLGYTTKEELAEINKFTGRQVDYYGNAAKYLGLINISKQNYLTTTKGQLIANTDKIMKNRIIVEQMMEIPSIRGVFVRIKDQPLSLDIVIESMHTAGVFLNPLSTEPRRAKTIISWVEWSVEKVFT